MIFIGFAVTFPTFYGSFCIEPSLQLDCKLDFGFFVVVFNGVETYNIFNKLIAGIA